ncbi:hypothetical protein [Quadrisphaera sp. INWT6]|uniref:hypothetical protein n=1 Tax=Quadrisphaera sp. INWT6 TaxID=2596917 RepID=UPI0018924C7D|nr:hypothetical protein [Quadrisphaera sp. INWT6]MBF5083759.1 hypothetical protein [Quadrisphaera sp. INWT6]
MSAVLVSTVLAAGGGVPDPGAGVAPPGSEGLLTILQWAAWIGFGVAVLGVVLAGIAMAISHRRGEGGEHMSRLGWVFAGCIVIGSAAGLVGALV